MDLEKLKLQEGLLREQNIEIKYKNNKLKQENEKLRQELERANGFADQLKEEKQKNEIEYAEEQKRWQDTTNTLKQVISDLDYEKKMMEFEMNKLSKVAERCNRAEYMVVELKYSLEQINENRNIEKEAAKEQMDSIIEELTRTRHEKEEILSEKLMLEGEIVKYRKKIIQFEERIKDIKKSANKKSEISNWCMERKNRRDVIRNKQNRVYVPQSTINLQALVKMDSFKG